MFDLSSLLGGLCLTGATIAVTIRSLIKPLMSILLPYRSAEHVVHAAGSLRSQDKTKEKHDCLLAGLSWCIRKGNLLSNLITVKVKVNQGFTKPQGENDNNNWFSAWELIVCPKWSFTIKAIKIKLNQKLYFG